jgi:glycosyltransferase involved in cell wall biosynthesis
MHILLTLDYFQGMFEAMQLSFIIPVHNGEKTLRRCLDSILALDLDPGEREIIAVNNGSRDLTSAILASYPEVQTLTFDWASRSRARNTGAVTARGQWCVFIDSDVELEADWAQVMLSEMQNQSALIYQGPIIPANTDGQNTLNRYRYHIANETTGGKFSLLFINVRESPMVNSAACVYQREIFYQLGGFDELLERHEDIDLSKRANLKGIDIHYVADARAHVHYHGNGWWAYWLRAYAEGVTKIDYLAKWEQVFMAQKQNFALPQKQFPKFDGYFLPRGIHFALRALGRVIGNMMRKPRFTPLEQHIKLQYTEHPD